MKRLIASQSSTKRSALVAAILVAFTLVFTALATTARAADNDPVIVEHDVPGKPLNIVVEEPGKVWVTMPGENIVGRLTVASGSSDMFTPYSPSTADSQPYDLVMDGDLIWFTEKAGNKIGRLDTGTGNIVEYTIPTAASMPTGIDVAPDGRVWFVEQAGNKLAVFNPANSKFTEYPVPAEVAGSGLEDVAVRNADQVWFTAPDADKAVVYILSTGLFDLIATKSPAQSYESPLSVTMDPSNRPWVTSFGSNAVGRYTPETLNFWRWFGTPSVGAGVVGIDIRDIGSFWQVFYTEKETNQVGLFVVRESDTKRKDVAVVPMLTPNSRPWGVAVDGDGHAWIAESNAEIIAEWVPPYYHRVLLPYVSK